jgi:hypothetical protein
MTSHIFFAVSIFPNCEKESIYQPYYLKKSRVIFRVFYICRFRKAWILYKYFIIYKKSLIREGSNALVHWLSLSTAPTYHSKYFRLVGGIIFGFHNN